MSAEHFISPSLAALIDSNKPLLTIGMAVVDDPEGVWWTVQIIRSHFKHLMPLIKFLIVDNKPDAPSSKQLKMITEGWMGMGNAGARYLPLVAPTGTAPPRNKVFEVADTPYVLCMDSHCILEPNSLDALLEYYIDNPLTQDLLSGPIVYDTMQHYSTHFNPVWREQMYGIWADAWVCKCNDDSRIFNPDEPLKFTHLQLDHKVPPTFHSLDMDMVPVTSCPRCGSDLPEPTLDFVKQLVEQGYRKLDRDTDTPYEIPGQGLGVFSCRKDAWLGFNEHFRGFGGEELYIHDKFRMAGRKCYSIPALKWIHRFMRINGTRYSISRWDKARNYVLGHLELGKPLDAVKEHFLSLGSDGKPLMTEAAWAHLIADPVNHIEPHSDCKTCGQKVSQAPKSLTSSPPVSTSTADFYKWGLENPRDLEKHFPMIRHYAAKCSSAVQFSKRRESILPILMGLSESTTFETAFHDDVDTSVLIASHCREKDENIDGFVKSLNAGFKTTRFFVTHNKSEIVSSIPQCDLLFIDSTHTERMLASELDKFAHNVRRFIIMHDTQTYQEKGEDGGPGLFVALRKFLRANPKWSVIHHSTEQFGLTVIGCKDEDKPKLPTLVTQAINFTKASATHLASGAGKVSLPIYEERLATCSICPQRTNSNCAVCGCNLEVKASWQTSECPIANWKQ
jgi:hypothetical protein